MVIATYMLPPVALAVPLYMGLSHLGMLNNVFGLALVYLTILAPFTTWLMKSGFDSIPREIESAAMIDGAGLFQTLRIITLPLAAPVMATSSLFAFLLAWDEFFYALLFTSDQRAKTLTVAIADLAGRPRFRLWTDRDGRRARRPAPGADRSRHATRPDFGAHQRRRQGMNMTAERTRLRPGLPRSIAKWPANMPMRSLPMKRPSRWRRRPPPR